MSYIRTTRAFTLIELLIVIAIIGVLTVAFLPTLRGGQAQARDAAKRALIGDVNKVLENQINEYGKMVKKDGTSALGADGDYYCLNDQGVAESQAVTELLGRVPQAFPDIGTNGYCNGQIAMKRFSSSSYMLIVGMENAKNGNVKQGQGANEFGNIGNASAGLAQTTNEAAQVGTGANGIFYYMMTR